MGLDCLGRPWGKVPKWSNRLRKATWNAFHAPLAWQTPPNKRPPPPHTPACPAGLLLGSDKPRPSLGVPKGTPDPPYLHTLGLAAAPGPQRRHWPSRDGFVAKKKRGLGVGIADPKWAGLSHETMNPMRGSGEGLCRPNRVGTPMGKNTYRADFVPKAPNKNRTSSPLEQF